MICEANLSGIAYLFSQILAYELMNEPVADDHEQWNNIVAECVRTIRLLEPERSLLVGSNRWQGYETMRYLKIPENDPNLIISFIIIIPSC